MDIWGYSHYCYMMSFLNTIKYKSPHRLFFFFLIVSLIDTLSGFWFLCDHCPFLIFSFAEKILFTHPLLVEQWSGSEFNKVFTSYVNAKKKNTVSKWKRLHVEG
jgi:hypothetical protein